MVWPPQRAVTVFKHLVVLTSDSTAHVETVTTLLFVFQGFPDSFLGLRHVAITFLPELPWPTFDLSWMLPTAQLFLSLSDLVPWGSPSVQWYQMNNTLVLGTLANRMKTKCYCSVICQNVEGVVAGCCSPTSPKACWGKAISGVKLRDAVTSCSQRVQYLWLVL